jgi:D-alanyl-D-alanine carboxypeptidase
MRSTKRPIQQARPIPARRVRRARSRQRSAAPFFAFLLSLLALLSPELTLAPMQAVEPVAVTRSVDRAPLQDVPRIPRVVDTRTAGAAELVSLDLADAPAYQAALDEARYVGGAYGVTFAAVRDGQLLWSGSSGRERDGRTPLAADASLVIGSVTKTFVSAAILQLAQAGVVDLEASARSYLPQLGWLDRAITVHELLNHTSGLADVFNDTTRSGIEEHPEHAWSVDEVFATLHSPWYPPGENWAYANTNYLLLGLIVERMTGTSLADELQRRFLGPLGLTGTRMLVPTDAGPLAPAWTTIFWGSGAMVSSAADLARWGDALYGDAFLEPATLAEMTVLVPEHDYGLGVQRIEIGGASGYGHTGLLNTYTTLLFHVPSVDVTMALLVNRSHVDLGAMLLASPADGRSLFELATGLEPEAPSPAPSPSSSPAPRRP